MIVATLIRTKMLYEDAAFRRLFLSFFFQQAQVFLLWQLTSAGRAIHMIHSQCILVN